MNELFNEVKDNFLLELNKSASNHVDLTIKSKDLVFNDYDTGINYQFKLSNQKVLSLTNLAKSQLLKILTIPESYINRCQRDIELTNVKHWLNRKGNKEFLLRNTISTDTYITEAVLSSRYKPLDNHIVFPLIFDAFSKLEEAVNHQLNISIIESQRRFTHININFSDIKLEVNNQFSAFPGILITNSELGLAALKIQPYLSCYDLYRDEYCYISDYNEVGTTRFLHLKNTDTSLIEKAIKEAIGTSLSAMPKLLLVGQEEVNLDEAKDLLKKSSYLKQHKSAIDDIIENEFKDTKQVNKLKLASKLYHYVDMIIADGLNAYLLENELGRWLNVFNNNIEKDKNDIQELIGSHYDEIL